MRVRACAHTQIHVYILPLCLVMGSSDLMSMRLCGVCVCEGMPVGEFHPMSNIMHVEMVNLIMFK